MSAESVRAFLTAHGRAGDLLETADSTATVAQAAEAFGVGPERIAKTLAFRNGSSDGCVLVVMAGDARTDNAAFKTRFGLKASMLRAEDVESSTGHPVGGVCPFANPATAQVHLDTSLRRFDTVLPAAGSAHSAIELTLDDLETLSGSQGWVTVSRLPDRSTPQD